jgi:protein-tyrosine-phosphatase
MPAAAAGHAHRVLFLCTGNSARSILAESLLRRLGANRFEAASAGSHPKGRVHPLALELLDREGLPTAGLRSKCWDEFAGAEARFDTVITVCDEAAGEACPVVAAESQLHWSIPDPAAVRGSDAERRTAFESAYRDLETRIREFVRKAKA